MTANNQDQNEPLSPQDQALRDRLAKLRTLPVDLQNFDRQLRSSLPPAPSPSVAPSLRRFVAPFLAIAATLILLASASLVIFQSNELRADPSQMVQMHEDLVAGKGHTMSASTIADAQKLLANQSADSSDLKLPRPPHEHLMACCMKPLSNKNVACVLLDYNSAPVTMSVAKATDFALPRVTPTTQNGQKYYVEESHGYHMVMLNRSNLWICLIAKLPPDDLITLATKLEF